MSKTAVLDRGSAAPSSPAPTEDAVRATESLFVGIISERDIVRAFSQYGETLTSMGVKDIMVHPLVTVKPDDSVDHAMRLMTQYHVRHLPVVSDRKLV